MSQNGQNDAPLFGAALMMGFVTFGPLIDMFAKLAAASVPVGQIAVTRLVVQGAILVPIAVLLGRWYWPDLREWGLHLLRGALILASTAFIVAAVRFMPIADAIAIFFVEPMFLMLLGAVLLGESIGPRRLIACIVGFIGAMLVIQPNFENFGIVALYPLGTAVCFAFYLILTRTMAQRINPLTLQAHTSLGAIAIGVPVLWMFRDAGIFDLSLKWPEGVEIWWLLGCGAAAALSHLFLSYAFRFAPTTLLGPMHYLEIVSASVLGYLVFGDLFNGMAALGVGIIVVSGLYLVWRENQAQQDALKAPS